MSEWTGPARWGICYRCREAVPADEAVLVAVPFSSSGPGGPAWYACPDCDPRRR